MNTGFILTGRAPLVGVYRGGIEENSSFPHRRESSACGKEAGVPKQACVYILASKPNGTLYTGVTSDLVKRIYQHKSHLTEGFTDRYDVDRLVWFEMHATMESAIQREKAIKKWRRAWKIKRIERSNPEWRDLYPDLLG